MGSLASDLGPAECGTRYTQSRDKESDERPMAEKLEKRKM